MNKQAFHNFFNGSTQFLHNRAVNYVHKIKEIKKHNIDGWNKRRCLI